MTCFYRFKKWKYFIRTLGGDVIRRKSLKMFLRRIHFFLCNLGRDLYDPFEELLQLNPRAYALFFSRHRLGESLARRMILAIKD